MATYTKRMAGTSDATGSCALDGTFDTVTKFATLVVLTNGMAQPATLVVTRASDGATFTVVAQPGQTLTQAIPPNTFQDPRSFYPNPSPYSFTLG